MLKKRGVEVDIVKEFINVGSVNVEVFKADTDYCFYLKSSNEDVFPITDIIEDTLNLF